MLRSRSHAFLLFSAALTVSCSSTPALTDHDVVFVADFVNSTGDSSFDEALKPLVIVGLQQSPFFTLLPDQRMQRTLRQMQRPATEPVVAEAARDLCKRAGAKATVEGSIAATGSAYQVILAANNCETGASLAKQEVHANGREDVLPKLAEAVKGLRGRLGEPSASISKYDADLIKATSASLDALRAYGQGLKTRVMAGDDAAMVMFRQAAERDPMFGLAHAKVAVVTANTGQFEISKIATQKAYELRGPMTEYERLYINWNYAARVIGDQKQVKDGLTALTTTYPRDFAARNNFGVYYNNIGDLEAALKEYQAASDIAPDEPGPLSNAAYVLFALGRADEASQYVDRALAIRPDPGLAVTRWITARVEDSPRAAEFEAVAKSLAGPDQMAVSEATLAAWGGRLQQFDKLQSDVIARARATGNLDMAEGIATSRLITLAAYRRGRDLETLKAAAAKEKNPVFLVQQTSALAMMGEVEIVRAGVKKLESDPAGAAALGPPMVVARAYVQAKDGHPEAAIATIDGTLRAIPRARDLNYFIGDILEQAGQTDAAIARFQTMIGSFSYLGPNPLIPASRLKLAKLLLKKNDAAGAKVQLDALLKQWKDADGDFPALTEAKALRAKIS